MDDRRRARLHVAGLVSDHLLSLAGLLMFGVLPRLLLVYVCFADVCLCTLYCLRWLRRLQLVDNCACTAVPGGGGNCIYNCGFKENCIPQR